ncbi:MAG: ribosome biogenesis GTPase Der [Patescibacteria group bacterium]|jgi:GTP-binding protein
MTTHPTLALVGKTNVGKSTLVNRISEQRSAFTSATPHTTRDRTRVFFVWRGLEAIISDTAGFNLEAHHPLQKSTRILIQKAMETADVIGFVVDGREGITVEDRSFVKELRKTKKPVILIVNKVDNSRVAMKLDDSLHRLGFKDVAYVSAANGSGVGDLLDMFFDKVETPPDAEKKGNEPRVILVGQTNAGKSSLANAMLGSDEILTSSQPHTTRDAQRHSLSNKGIRLELIDTAGLSRSKQTGIEELTQRESRLLLRDAQVGCLVLDANAEITVEDRRITRLIEQANIARMLIINKMDLIEDRPRKEDSILRQLPGFRGAPHIWVSAKTGRNVKKILPMFTELLERYNFMLPEEELTELNSELFNSTTWQKLKFEYIEQDASRPPKFRIRYRGRVSPPEAKLDHLSKQLQERYSLEGVPVIITTSRR